MSKLKMLISSVYAGGMIGIGGIIYLSVENRIIASLLFSFGLLTIVTQGFYLYTGKIGFVKKTRELLDMAVVVIGNYVGALLIAGLANAAKLPIDSSKLVAAKLEKGVGTIFLLSVFCGIMMYLAIDNYNKSQNIIFVIAPVMIFILSGFEHSVADMFYFNLACSFNLKTIGYIGIMVAGNGIGAKLFDIGCQFVKTK